ncbi:hypothetical protein, partial [Ruminiclostridium josui]|uniref:hypothetical protein n=1 Tax=Ruminiclostridium josui TaxID=1499 RepID=UPI000A4F90F8
SAEKLQHTQQAKAHKIKTPFWKGAIDMPLIYYYIVDKLLKPASGLHNSNKIIIESYLQRLFHTLL